MLKIRLSRGGKHKSPFFRIVLTEHTKSAKSGYKEVLGWFNPMRHEMKMDIDTMKEWIGKGAQPSNRVAKLAYKYSSDEFFKPYITETKRVRRKRNAPEEEETPAPVEEAPAPKEEEEVETPNEEATTEEAPTPKEEAETPMEDTPAEEASAPAETSEDDKKEEKAA